MPVMLLLSCAILVATSVAAYLANHVPPFLEPISLLIYRPYPGFYHGVVAEIILLAGLLGARFWMVRDAVALVLALAMAALGLVLLLWDNGHQPLHDHAALALMAATGLLGVQLARTLADWRCTFTAYAAACGVSVFPSGDMLLIGLAENILMLSTVVLATIHAFQIRPGRYDPPWSLSSASPGVMGGFGWALWALLICSVSGGLARELLSGPAIAVISWLGGWLAWREEMLLRVRATILLLSLGGGFLLVSLGSGQASIGALLLVLFLTSFAIALVGLYEMMIEALQ